MTDPAITFYQSLAGISFTLLGLWFAVLQIEGMATGSLFVVGLCFVWLAFAEAADSAQSAAGVR